MLPLANQPGQLAVLTRLLGDGGVDIRSLDADQAEGQDFGIIRIVVDRYDEALQLLRDAGYAPVTEDALLIRAPDEPGSLARVAARFSDAGINVKSLHILHRQEGESLVSLVTDDNELARDTVADLLVDQHP
ncbi:ACT domain-containing protein [Haloferula rosea]|uniref:ACT domain-containing protein n=1 Tax=Haloferula rosea TaxID=490093 RepID=A0A934VFX4_9BACT|nr:ACT domain-containing protein [Haloferula rosea]MBK1827030.1 ACT domain-containing protein [Haloferula rosea]